MHRLTAMMLPLLLAIPAAAQDEIADGATDLGSGTASYYGDELAGNRTASGERFDPDDLTAAHRTLAFGSRVRVTNLANGQSVVVRINDRGPFSRGRVIDVSHAAAREIGMDRAGLARVSMTLLDNETELAAADNAAGAAAVGAAD
ncbi:septal ring lytic transglycosylase RlpA family protein [Sphingopyxis indica]|uniref:septal ring lytic transglycosylase RlpA family protein n=1 Tax=Sphingopyxis indica TaxID=436663 RepID=UPI002938DCBC|nr:septal ring lytic transglycosylase RlpA family protein [Sphingopyxis indica]WOF43717.1 septal ring lytic transglycosylase RlpA family protein [Sphingopyxis indica]